MPRSPAVASDTIIITLQNGINSVADLQALLPATHVMGGAAYFQQYHRTWRSDLSGQPTSHFSLFDMGTGVSSRANYCRAFNAAGLGVQVSDDTERMLWEKFLLIAGTSAATALTVGRWDPCAWTTHALGFREAIQETRNVALASGVTPQTPSSTTSWTPWLAIPLTVTNWSTSKMDVGWNCWAFARWWNVDKRLALRRLCLRCWQPSSLQPTVPDRAALVAASLRTGRCVV